MRSIWSSPAIRPYLLLTIVVLLLAAVDFGHARFLSVGTAYSALQSFSTFGLVALGLGLVMLIGEFDLSVAGVFGLAGCIALLSAPDNLWIGMLCAVATGAAFGLGQGLLIVLFDLGSVAVTLGGLLTATGIAYVITHNRAISSDDLDLAMTLNEPMINLFSLRSVVTLGIFIIAAVIFATTRLGRDLIATGSDRKAAIIAGVSVKKAAARRIRIFRMYGRHGRRHAQLWPRLRNTVWPVRCISPCSGCGNSWWRIIGRRQRHSLRHRRRHFDTNGLTFWP